MSTTDQTGQILSPSTNEAVETAQEMPVHGQDSISPAAKRALAEAAQRRKLADLEARQNTTQKEIAGPKGPDPVRYGDWEKNGIVSDF